MPMKTKASEPGLQRRCPGLFGLLVVALLAHPSVVRGISFSLDPADQSVELGTPVSINVRISGLGSGSAPSLGAFDFNLGFDPAVLAFTSISFGDPVLGDQLGPLLGSITGSSVDAVTGSVNQFGVSLDLPSDLNALQADTFVLTSLTFSSVGVGATPLIISDLVLGDAEGAPLSAQIINGSARVTKTVVVPEVGSTAVLMIAGFAAISAMRRGRV